MSDCSSSTMMPKELRMCKTCGHENVCAYRTSLLVNCNNWIESSERHERLAQVAREMLRYARIRLQEHWTEEDARAVSAYREELEALGVSVDD